VARADLLLDLVRSGARGDQTLFRKSLEALIAEERSKQHHILADRLAVHLQMNGSSAAAQPTPTRRNGHTDQLFFEIVPQRRIDDLILPDTVLAACRELVEEHHRADLLRSHNLEPRHRLLLAGPPGNGKTSLAEALAAELSVPLLVVRYEAVIASYLGETAVRLSRLFEQVRSQRCALFFDEFDVVGKERGDVHETGEIKRVVSSLLLQVDSLPSHVVVITATNHPELLDRAVWRRFQLRLELPPPGRAQLLEWVRRLEGRLCTKTEIAASTLVKRLGYPSFSELEQFAQDVQRRFVLSIPGGDLKRIIDERLEQWESRFSLPNPSRRESGRA
jgi:AAA+ superfamily predicted ATPase